MKYLTVCLMLVLALSIHAQEVIDGTIPFQADPAKKYSLYVPSSYNANQSNKLMLGLHPLNTNRWNAKSWRDTLIHFAEENHLLLICPDGGVDGKIDDPIDTAFTTLLLDSMNIWYNVDKEKVFCMGFSWGGLTTYSYGLNHIDRFAGFMPIGAAINGTSNINNVLSNARNNPFYIIHGSDDSPNTRFIPVRDALIDNGAVVETKLMTGVGHTIDFPNRNQILKEAFEWLDNQSNSTGLYEKPKQEAFYFSPNPIQRGATIGFVNTPSINDGVIQFYDQFGILISSVPYSENMNTEILSEGVYYVSIQTSEYTKTGKLIVK